MPTFTFCCVPTRLRTLHRNHCRHHNTHKQLQQLHERTNSVDWSNTYTEMPQCKARFCKVKRGQGISAFAIPDPKKNRQLCQQWIHNLGLKNLDIKTFKYSKQNIVCERHFEEHCFKRDKQVTLSLYLSRIV